MITINNSSNNRDNYIKNSNNITKIITIMIMIGNNDNKK